MSAFPNSPRHTKGGLVLIDPDSGRVERIIILQHNPDTLTRALQARSVGSESGSSSEVLRLKGPAVETIKLDAKILRSGSCRRSMNIPGGYILDQKRQGVGKGTVAPYQSGQWVEGLGYATTDDQGYRDQMTAYTRLFAMMEDRPVRAGLFFPLLGSWREVERTFAQG